MLTMLTMVILAIVAMVGDGDVNNVNNGNVDVAVNKVLGLKHDVDGVLLIVL